MNFVRVDRVFLGAPGASASVCNLVGVVGGVVGLYGGEEPVTSAEVDVALVVVTLSSVWLASASVQETSIFNLGRRVTTGRDDDDG